MRTIVVTLQCQTPGVAAALAQLLPHDRIEAVPQPDPADAAAEAAFAQRVRDCDVWVHSNDDGAVSRLGLADGARPLRLRTPLIVFHAFHPDLCYLGRGSADGVIVPHYNSTLVAWAWNRGLAPADAVRLFRSDVFAALGYFDRWRVNVALLRQRFAEAGWAESFDAYFLGVQRTGLFMHSLNHPRPDAMVRLARLVALRLGAGREALERDVVVTDSLAHTVWPLYPALADALGLPGGSYHWRVYEQPVEGLPDYVAYSYQCYAQLGVAPGELRNDSVDAAALDAVLERALKGSA